MPDNRSEFEKTYFAVIHSSMSLLAGAGVGIGSNTALFVFDNSMSIPLVFAVSGAFSAFAGATIWNYYSVESFLDRNFEWDLTEKKSEDDNP